MTTTTTHEPETLFGVTTSWLPLTTPFLAHDGCSSAFWKNREFGLVAFDPGFDVYKTGPGVTPPTSCYPAVASSWWDQAPYVQTSTSLSLGPLICPQQYYTATESIYKEGSTFIACCPT